MIMVLVALCGGVGAAARFFVDGVVNSLRRHSVPQGSLAVNLLGSFGLGLLAGWWTGRSDEVLLLVGTGFFGGFTTFSTATLESARLIAEGRWRTGVVLAVGMVVACVAAAAFGWSLAP
ncbi:fluoride efflux transporter CrcB [Propionibacteriaceae bacterium G1746]|uniref:fluoride efflux transporter CrcB n=1 Tax=Aestuariimicrobium sp. G57 TaxID=3418485 RepID=UPI003C25B1FE